MGGIVHRHSYWRRAAHTLPVATYRAASPVGSVLQLQRRALACFPVHPAVRLMLMQFLCGPKSSSPIWQTHRELQNHTRRSRRIQNEDGSVEAKYQYDKAIRKASLMSGGSALTHQQKPAQHTGSDTQAHAQAHAHTLRKRVHLDRWATARSCNECSPPVAPWANAYGNGLRSRGLQLRVLQLPSCYW